MESARLEEGFCLTSCHASAASEQEEVKSWECDWRDDMTEEAPASMLRHLVNKRDGSGLRGAEVVLPNIWNIALTVLEALEYGK